MAEWIDISLPLGNGTPIFPGDPAIEVTTVTTLEQTPYHLSHVAMGSHSGTHVDAPAHFVRGGTPLGQIPLSRWTGPAWVVVLPEADSIEPEALAAAWPQGESVERVLLRTPNSRLWGTPEAGHRYQALSEAGAAWLLDRGVKLVGIDSLSIEADATGTFPVHHLLLGNDVLILEGLNLKHVAAGPYELLCLPLRLEVPDGAPVRAVLRR
jgi:arylformamidase